MQFISIDQIISVTIAAEIIRNHEIQAWLGKTLQRSDQTETKCDLPK